MLVSSLTTIVKLTSYIDISFGVNPVLNSFICNKLYLNRSRNNVGLGYTYYKVRYMSFNVNKTVESILYYISILVLLRDPYIINEGINSNATE